MEFPFNIFATARANDFIFGMQFGFTKAHHKIYTQKKSGRGNGLGELPKILELPFNIFEKVEASDFKFGMQLGFSEAHHKITPRDKVGVALG